MKVMPSARLLLSCALKALELREEAKFEPKTSAEMWELGFDCGEEVVGWHQDEKFVAILSEELGEIELHLADPDATKLYCYVIDVHSGLIDLRG